jgi:hypothetical protein
MENLLAIDVAVLPPPDVSRRAMELSAALPLDGPHGLRLDADHLPHVTLTQQFVREDELDVAADHIDSVLNSRARMRLHVSGVGRSGHSVWMAIERTPDLVELHELLMEALRGLERPGGTPAAFVDGDGRVADVLWVSGYRLKSSFADYLPHITLGHGEAPLAIEPFEFDATTVAICHLGRHCTCRRALRSWALA